MKKKLPNSLIKKQEKIRSETIAAVTNAIIELEAQGYSIKIRDIMDVTGLSRSVFAKPHIRKILVEYGISKPKWVDTLVRLRIIDAIWISFLPKKMDTSKGYSQKTTN